MCREPLSCSSISSAVTSSPGPKPPHTASFGTFVKVGTAAAAGAPPGVADATAGAAVAEPAGPAAGLASDPQAVSTTDPKATAPARAT
ncbi:hypothetical protein GCM10009663_71290 [Kitasatospora arboriphila]|uniref:Uncharacterized protein n=1 Tax=Kitasatospora arboriphila TaxID=258052 RepID=A0ABP4ESS5_9ACTN